MSGHFTINHPRMRLIVRNAVRWHLTGFDAVNGGGMDADGVDENGWSVSEQGRITEIVVDPDKLSDVLVRWMEHNDRKPPGMQNESIPRTTS